MANRNGGKTCPKCGMNLGQKHLCPVCDETEGITESSASNPAAGGGNAAPAASQIANYISLVIKFIGEHLDDWDEEFNSFFDGLPGDHDYIGCYDTCSKISRIIPKDKPVAGKITGSMTINAMQGLKSIFPDLSDKEARGLAMDLLRKRLEPFFAPPPPGSDSRVMEMYNRIMTGNDSVAQYNLGLAFLNGEGVEKDVAKALTCFRTAAKQGNVFAKNILKTLGY